MIQSTTSTSDSGFYDFILPAYEEKTGIDIRVVAVGTGQAIKNAEKTAMSLSDTFCVDRHRSHFLDLVKNKLDIIFANEQEMMSLIDAKDFKDVINFGKNLKKLLVITRGEKGAISINGEEIVENGIEKNLNVTDLTGAGDLFAAGFLHGNLNNLSITESLNKGREMSSRVIQQIGARL